MGEGGEGRESDLDWFLTFLLKEVQRREHSQSFGDMVSPVNGTAVDYAPYSGTAAALQSSSKVGCAFCDR